MHPRGEVPGSSGAAGSRATCFPPGERPLRWRGCPGGGEAEASDSGPKHLYPAPLQLPSAPREAHPWVHRAGCASPSATLYPGLHTRSSAAGLGCQPPTRSPGCIPTATQGHPPPRGGFSGWGPRNGSARPDGTVRVRPGSQPNPLFHAPCRCLRGSTEQGPPGLGLGVRGPLGGPSGRPLVWQTRRQRRRPLCLQGPRESGPPPAPSPQTQLPPQ